MRFAEASTHFFPQQLRLLFIAEAPPAYRVNRLFYFTDLKDGDTLFLEMMKVLYPAEVGYREGRFHVGFSVKGIRQQKAALLRRFQGDGYYLIDAHEEPMPDNADTPTKIRLMQNALPKLLKKVRLIVGDSNVPIVLIGGVTYSVCAEALRRDGRNVANTSMINHPARGGQALFRSKLTAVLSTLQSSPKHKVRTQLGKAAVRIFATNDRMNQILIEHLDPAVWRAIPPGKTRTIAAIFAHMHNVRSKWVRLTAPHLKAPQQLNRAECTPLQVRERLAESSACCAEMLGEALAGAGGHIEKFRRDGWASPWPPGVEMLCYMLSHEAHHRGQVCMLTHVLGFPLPDKVTSSIWNWEHLWKEFEESGSQEDYS